MNYDAIVIGGGSPGEHAAGALAEGGLRVAVVGAFSEIYLTALKALNSEIAAARQVAGVAS